MLRIHLSQNLLHRWVEMFFETRPMLSEGSKNAMEKKPSEKTMLFFTNALFHELTVLWRGSIETSSEAEGFSNQSFEQPDNSSMKKVSLIVVKMKRRLHSTIENNGTPNRCFSTHPVIVAIRQL